jgi:hypothetical protein
MGKDSIQKGSEDSWTITPKRIEALDDAAMKLNPESASGKGISAGLSMGGLDARSVPSDFFNSVLHDPACRNPLGYIIPSNQPDFPTAVKFINTLEEKNGITILKAKSNFQVAAKNYLAGSYIVKTDRAFRPHVLDMFEPQNYPNDFPYPSGPQPTV